MQQSISHLIPCVMHLTASDPFSSRPPQHVISMGADPTTMAPQSVHGGLPNEYHLRGRTRAGRMNGMHAVARSHHVTDTLPGARTRQQHAAVVLAQRGSTIILSTPLARAMTVRSTPSRNPPTPPIVPSRETQLYTHAHTHTQTHTHRSVRPVHQSCVSRSPL